MTDQFLWNVCKWQPCFSQGDFKIPRGCCSHLVSLAWLWDIVTQVYLFEHHSRPSRFTCKTHSVGSPVLWHVLDVVLDSWMVHGFPNSFFILHHMPDANGGNGLPGKVSIFPWSQAGQWDDHQGALHVFPFCCHKSLSRTFVFNLLCTLNFYWGCKKYQKVKLPTFTKSYPFLPALLFVLFPTDGQHCTYSSLHTLRKKVQKVLAGTRTSMMIPHFLFYSWICWVCFILFPLIWIYFPSMFAFPVDIIFSWFIFLNSLSSSSYLYSSPFSLYLFPFPSSDYFAIVKFPGFLLFTTLCEAPGCEPAPRRDPHVALTPHRGDRGQLSWNEVGALLVLLKACIQDRAAIWMDLLLGSKGRMGLSSCEES